MYVQKRRSLQKPYSDGVTCRSLGTSDDSTSKMSLACA